MVKNKINDVINSFYVLTLGCSKNVVDSERMIGLLESNNFHIAESISEAETLIINTCGFIKPAKAESINVIFEAAEMKKHGSLKNIIVSGCLSERYGEELKKQIGGVDYFFGINSSEQILKVLSPDLKYNLIGERHLLTPGHYAYLKIAEGCNHECSFCAIPYIRGSYISSPHDDIIEETKRLVDKGVKEFVVIAQDTTYYGRDINFKPGIAGLLNDISNIAGVDWVRLMYAYPLNFPYEVLNVIASIDNICKYIDIPFQHISNRILKSMRRGTSHKQIEELVLKIRQTIPDLAIRSTFITGYPGETEEEFSELKNFVESAMFERVGVFTYSHEDETPAYSLEDDIPEDIKIERRNILMESQQGISLKMNKSKIGSKCKVLIDEKQGEFYIGRTEHDAPDVDNSVYIKSNLALQPGDFVDVLIESAEEYDLHGNVV